MIDLTNLEEINKLDPKNVYGSTEMFPDQCRQIWQDAKKVTYPKEYKNVSNIIFCGMGGSSYGGRVMQSLFMNELSVPVYTNDDYHLPAYVDGSSLILLGSYSGTTEEVLSAGKEGLERGAKITGIVTGGAIEEFLRSNNLPRLIFTPQFNPSGQPRLGTGYNVLGAIAVLNQIGLVHIPDEIIKKAIDMLQSGKEQVKKQAMEFAKKIFGNIPVIFAAEFLKGNAYILRNQTNETAKSFSAFSELPDLNHHLMEGLKNPIDKKLIVLFLTSILYSDILKKRIALTREVVEKNNIAVLEYEAAGEEKISQMLNVLSFGGYLVLYLAFLYGQDPSLIPWVDYFKEKLSKG